MLPYFKEKFAFLTRQLFISNQRHWNWVVNFWSKYNSDMKANLKMLRRLSQCFPPTLNLIKPFFKSQNKTLYILVLWDLVLVFFSSMFNWRIKNKRQTKKPFSPHEVNQEADHVRISHFLYNSLIALASTRLTLARRHTLPRSKMFR